MDQVVRIDDVLIYIDLALDGMLATVADLGDELVNARPDLAGANSAFQIVTHCCGVMNHWGGVEISGRLVERDRAAEFEASGTVAELAALVERTRRTFGEDLRGADLGEGSLGAHERDGFTKPERAGVATKGGVLMHVYEELAQHRGHLDLTADLVRVSHEDQST